MTDYEGLGVFYLGRPYDLEAGKALPGWMLYDSKDLTTHAVCVGMTGSGKTGLCVSLLEEAGIDGIPAIAIDPKGDLGNLMLTFPNLEPADFLPWIDPAEATRRGQTPEQMAEETAKRWRDGLAKSDQSPERIARFRDAVDLNIYTPGSSAGRPLAVLKNLAAPADVSDAEALRDHISGTVSSLLALMGIDADPLQSREHILLATILDTAWRQGQDLDMGSLVRAIQSPPVERVGFIDLETFFPAKDRFTLAMRLNNLLASPGFAVWMEGEPLDIQRLLFTPAGKPRLSIISIAHLSESERMFFVTLLLHEVVAWMRRQSGTSSLRALLYMDEVFGFFPPTANPPAKLPMLTLLKQARAYGLGVVLATQNPVDLDYKGLSNAGTWFLGRLQTERDKARVLEGLEGAAASAGQAFDRARMEATLAGLGNRVFLMNNVHEDRPQVFQTRFALSYLRGPLTRDQIRTLMQSKPAESASAIGGSASSDAFPPVKTSMPSVAAEARPVLPPGITEAFVPPRGAEGSTPVIFRPALAARATVHFSQSSLGVETTKSVALLALVEGDVPTDPWTEAQEYATAPWDTGYVPPSEALFASLPSACAQAKNYSNWGTRLRDALYRNYRLKLWKCGPLKQVSRPGETEGDFRGRITHLLHEQRDLEIERLRTKYASRFATVDEQIRVAEQRVDREQEDVRQQTFQSMVSWGQSLLSMVMGRKLASSTNVTRAGASVRATSRISKKKQEVEQAKKTLEAREQKRADLEAAFEQDVEAIRSRYSPESIELEEVSVAPKKTDIAVEGVALVWTPWSQTGDGGSRPLF